MLEQLHISSQYLAAFCINYLDKKDDDSHTNLGWNPSTAHLETRANAQNLKLRLDFSSFSLYWIKKDKILSKLELNGAKHQDIIRWMNLLVTEYQLADSFEYAFHYDLPYPAISDDYIFNLSSESELSEIIDQYSKAQLAFEDFLSKNSLESDIRVWPHHFDLGLYTKISDSRFLGIGLAIPDSMMDSLYFYVSGWEGGNSVDTSTIKPLTAGEWKNDGFKGAVLASKMNQSKTEIDLFLEEAKDGFLS
jgi:hypothetical protein